MAQSLNGMDAPHQGAYLQRLSDTLTGGGDNVEPLAILANQIGGKNSTITNALAVAATPTDGKAMVQCARCRTITSGQVS